MYACHLNDPPLIRALVEYGKPPDVNLRDRYQHFSPLIEALHSCRADTDSMQVIQYLLQKGADVDVIGYKKGFFVFPHSPVTICIKRGNFPALKLLIQYGANLHVTPREYIQSFIEDSMPAYEIPYTLGQYRHELCLWGHGVVRYTVDSIVKSQHEDSAHKECLYLLLEAGCSASVDMYENHQRVQQIFSEITMTVKPRSLKWQCRKFLRMGLGFFKPVHVAQLPLPTPLKKYVLCMDL